MKTLPVCPALFRVVLICSVVLTVLIGRPSQGATLIWNGGTGNWDLTTTNWLDGTAVAWNNTTPDNAVFNAPGATVTFTQQNIIANSLLFNNAGTSYTLTGTTGSTLTLNSIDLAAGVPSVIIDGSLRVIANASGALSGSANSGRIELRNTSILDANVTNAIEGGYQVTLLDNASLNVNAFNALSADSRVDFVGSVNGVGGNMVLNGNSTTVGAIFNALPASLGSMGIVENGSTTAATLTLSLADASANLSFAGQIRDAGFSTSSAALSIVKNGSFTWSLSGSNSYTGGTTLNAGGLYVNNSSALGTGPLVINGGTLGALNGGTTLQNPITINSDFNIAPALAATDGMLLGGAVTLTTTPVITHTVSAGAVAFGGVIAGTGPSQPEGLTLDATGSWGRFTFRGANTYAGLTTVQGNAQLLLNGYFNTTIAGDILVQNHGVVQIGSGGGQQVSTTAVVTVNSPGNTIDGTTLEGFVLEPFASVTIGALNGNGTVGLSGASLTVGEGDFSGVISDGILAGSGAGALLKETSGTLRLSGANTYTGGTNVSSGILLVNNLTGSGTGTGDVNVSAGTLGGSGTIAGNVIMGDGRLAPGNSPGTLTIQGDLNMSSGTSMDFELGQAGTPGGSFNDLVNVGGNLTIAGSLNITQSSGGTFGPGVYRLFNYGGSLTDDGVTITSAPVPVGDLVLQTSVLQQVNLVNTQGLLLNYWDGAGPADDGAVDGGNGSWAPPGSTPSNPDRSWTTVDGTFNSEWQNGGYAIFQGTAGNVTVGGNANAPITFSGAQFVVDGYALNGGELTGSAAVTNIRVGDGTSAGAAMTATIGSVINGNTLLEKTDVGTLVFTGANTYTGGTNINGGTFLANNTSGSATGTGAVEVNSGGRLGGTGHISGDVTINSGGGLFGTAGQLLTLGQLTLGAGSSTDVSLGAPNSSALFLVNGDLTLGGTLNVIDSGGFGQGLYRLFDYTGALADNGMAITSSSLTGYALALQTTTANQVNLISLLGGPASIWDGGDASLHSNGTVNGGSGVWLASTADRNWTDTNGANNGYWSAGAFAIFQGAPGTVSVDNSAGAVIFSGAQFAVDGYALAGDVLTTTTADTVLRVGDGTSAGAAYTATISAPIAGSGGVRKTDYGTLVLAGTNTYAGGTTVSSGTLQVSADNNLGAASGGLNLDGGTLRYGAGFASARNVVLTNASVLDTQAYNATLSGGLSGAGSLTKTGTGSLILSGSNTQTGLTTIAQGGVVLQGGSLGQTTVNPGAGLFGNGTIRGALNNQGVVSPGFSPGTIFVTGNFTQGSAGSLLIELASATSFDQLQVSGVSNLGGTVVVSGLTGFTPSAGTTFRIMEANAINGRFDTLLSPWMNLSPMIRFEALYSPTDVTLSFTQLPFNNLPGGTPNQNVIGAALDRAFGAGQLPGLQGQLNALPNQQAVAQALRNIGPQRLARWYEQSNYISSAIVSSASERLSDDVRVPQWNSWLELVHRESWFKGDEDVDGAKGSTNGIITGADFAVTPDFAVGLLGGYTDEDINLDLGGSKTGIGRYTAGAYGRYDFTKLFFESVAGASYADYNSRRTTGLNGQAAGNTHGAERFASVKTGIPFDLGSIGFIPSASVQHVRWGADAFAETGAGDENLKLHDQYGESITTRGNFTFSKKIKRDKKRLVIKTKLDLSWWHELRQVRRELNAEIGNDPFTVLSRLPNNDGYIMMLSADITYRQFLTGFVRVTSEWSTTANRALEFRMGGNYKF